MKKIDFYKLSENNLEVLCSKIGDAITGCKVDSFNAGLSGELGSGKTTWMRSVSYTHLTLPTKA